MKIYTYKNCSTCRKATNWLDEQGLEYEEHPIRETPPGLKELQRMLDSQGGDVRKLFNTAGGDYRELNMKEKLPDMSESDALQLLSERGNLIKRPFLLSDECGLVGFKEPLWNDILI